MPDNRLTLFCLVDGETTSNAFSVKVLSTDSVDDLKKAIKAKKASCLNHVPADDLTLWRASIPNGSLHAPIAILALDDKTELASPSTQLHIVFPERPNDSTYIIVQLPPPEAILKKRFEQDPQYVPLKKRVRFEEAWVPFTASDGNQVELPPPWINILANTESVPKPRVAFAHLKDNLQAGDSIAIPTMGRTPNDFGSQGMNQILFVTEQMLELWDDMRGDQDRTYRKVISGPMGVGKSYLSYFLAARAYAEGWLVLYIEDAGELDTRTEEMSAQKVVQRFLAFNKDILTAIELRKLVEDYDGTLEIPTHAVSRIFRNLLKSRSRKTLVLVDEHWKLFEKAPYVPDNLLSLRPLSNFDLWEEQSVGTRMIFTGISCAKYEMTILDPSYIPESVVYVGPLSREIFSMLLDTYPRLAAQAIREEIIAITNCVPREIVKLATFLQQFPDPISMDHLQQWTSDQTMYLLWILNVYYRNRDQYFKDDFHRALVYIFLDSTDMFVFDSDFMDLGLIYRSKVDAWGFTQHHILCRPAQRALFEMFKTLPLPEDIRSRVSRISLDDLGGYDFERAVFQTDEAQDDE